MWQLHAAGGARHGIVDGDGDGDVCAVLDAEHNLDVAGDQGINTVCASLGTSSNTTNQSLPLHLVCSINIIDYQCEYPPEPFMPYPK